MRDMRTDCESVHFRGKAGSRRLAVKVTRFDRPRRIPILGAGRLRREFAGCWRCGLAARRQPSPREVKVDLPQLRSPPFMP